MARILCVDNSSTIRKVVKDIVEDLGEDFLEAENGKQALEVLGNEDIDLVILDFKIPVMSGLETISAIRRDESFPCVSILLLMPLEDKEHLIDALNNGVDQYILKPFSVNELQNKIKESLNIYKKAK